MPLPLAPLSAVLIGVVLALVGRDEIRRSSVPVQSTRGFLVVALVSATLLAPSLGYFLAFYPDWSWAYLFDAERLPSAVELVVVVGIALLPPLAFAWTASALRRHAVRTLVRFVAAAVIALAGLSVFLGPRLLVVGSYAAWRDGLELRPLGGSPLGYSILWIDACVAGGLVWVARQLRAIGRT